MIKIIKTADVPNVWPRVAPFLQRAVDHQSDWTLGAVHDEVANGRMALWAIDDTAAGVTQIQNFPRGRICVVFLCGGSGMNEWRQRWDESVSNYARGLGCVALTIHGRVGWARVYPDFIQEAVVLRRSL